MEKNVRNLNRGKLVGFAVSGVLTIAAGFVMILNPTQAFQILSVYFCLLLVTYGAIEMVKGFDRRNLAGNLWERKYGVGITSIAIGFLLIGLCAYLANLA